MSYQPNPYTLLAKGTAIDLTVTGDTILTINNAEKYIVLNVIAANRSAEPDMGTVELFSEASRGGVQLANGFDLSNAQYPTAESFVTADISYPTYGFGQVVRTDQEIYANVQTASTVPSTVDVYIYGLILE